MTSKLKVNLINDSGDNNIITSDGAGSFTASSSLASSVASVGGIQNTPAFQATLGTSITIDNNTQTKIPANTEDFDTDSCYDNSTNYRFTPTTAGKYFCYAQINTQGGTINQIGQVYLRKNGSTVKTCIDRYAGDGDVMVNCAAIIDFNGTTDYFEAWARQTTGSTKDLFNGNTFLGAYRIIGA
jgi:hypothetical protein